MCVLRAIAVAVAFGAMAVVGARAQHFSLAGDVAFLPPGATMAIIPRPMGPSGDWNGDSIADFAIHYTGFGLRIHSGFDRAIVSEWVGGPVYFNSGAYCCTSSPGRGTGFADLDGDGTSDLILGTGEVGIGPLDFAGQVEAISGATGQILYTIWGAALGDYYGAWVTVVGDTNGNGVADFIVFAYGAGFGDLYLVEGVDGSEIAHFQATYQFQFNESSPAAVGDVSGDGLADYAIGSASWNGNTGKVTIYSGGTTPAVIREHLGTQPGWLYGSGGKFSVGDADGDGVPDYVIGAPAWGGGVGNVNAPGTAWLHSGATGSVLTTFSGPPGTGWLGLSGNATDDVDGDGVNDLLLQAATAPLPGPWPGFPGAGQVQIYSTLTGSVLQIIDNPPIGLPPTGYPSNFGSAVQSVGDIDQDGRSDFVCGRTPGPLFIYTRDIVSVTPNPVPIGSTATFSLSVPAQANAPFRIVFSLTATTGIPIGTRVFPLDLDPVLLTSLSSPYLAGVLDSTGSMNLPIGVPPDPSLSGSSLKYSAFTISPTAPYYIKTFSPAKTVTFQ